MWSAGNACGPP